MLHVFIGLKGMFGCPRTATNICHGVSVLPGFADMMSDPYEMKRERVHMMKSTGKTILFMFV